MSSRQNSSLKAAKHLERLDLSENPLLDHQSIFDVILSMPRKDFIVNLSSNNITELPSTKKWLTTPFKSLGLSKNPIKTFPVDFINSKGKSEIINRIKDY